MMLVSRTLRVVANDRMGALSAAVPLLSRKQLGFAPEPAGRNTQIINVNKFLWPNRPDRC